jgi:hypothetical protein
VSSHLTAYSKRSENLTPRTVKSDYVNVTLSGRPSQSVAADRESSLSSSLGPLVLIMWLIKRDRSNTVVVWSITSSGVLHTISIIKLTFGILILCRE